MLSHRQTQDTKRLAHEEKLPDTASDFQMLLPTKRQQNPTNATLQMQHYLYTFK